MFASPSGRTTSVDTLTDTLTVENGVYPNRSVTLHGWQDVSVGVERQGHLRMAERLHDDTRIHALSEQQRSARVTEIVKPHIGEFRGRQ